MGELEIEDIGNCYIKAVDVRGIAFYFCAITKYGLTKILIIGPLSLDNNELLTKVTYRYEKLDFNRTKIAEKLDKMLNAQPKFELSQAMEISKEEFLEIFVNPLDLMGEELKSKEN